MRTIVIVCRDDTAGNSFDVHVDTSFATDLTWDELLGQVAVLTHPQLGGAGGAPLFRMETRAIWRDREQLLRAEIRELEEKLPRVADDGIPL